MKAQSPSKDILFGIIIPTYNRPDHLAEALESLLAQTYENWVAVVVNDASTVKYSHVEKTFTDLRIRFLHRKINGGCNAARNDGIDYAIAKGIDFITFLDDEETFVPECLAEGKKKIEVHPEYGWFLSNNFGERKECTKDIQHEGEMDWIDDYVYGKALRGDKTHMISTLFLERIRFDARYHASNMWPFYSKLALDTKIWAYTFSSKYIQYLEGGITKSKNKYPKSLRIIYSKFAKHAFVIFHRPTKWPAYKYLSLELIKTPKRLVLFFLGKIYSS